MIALAASVAAGAVVWALTAPPPAPDPAGSGLTLGGPSAGAPATTVTPAPETPAPPSPTTGRTSTSAATPSPQPSTFGRTPATRAARPVPAARVAPPTRLEIGALSLALPVQPVGVDADGAMALPEDPAVVGWYRFGAAPGAKTGSTVLAAHVDSRRFGVGPFADLSGLAVGSEIAVTTTAGRSVYRVERVDSIPRLRLDSDELFARGGEHRLRLVTCGGTYDRAAGGYSDNVVVTAVPA